MDKNNEKDFNYTYSASEQAELRRIRERYISKEKQENESKLERLRRLDASVEQKAAVVALVFGIIGVLILGMGMSLVMSELGDMLGLERGSSMALGVIIGVVGGVLVALAYPMHSFIVKHERKKVAPEILRLTDELIR